MLNGKCFVSQMLAMMCFGSFFLIVIDFSAFW